MTTTPELINALVADATPVRRLRPPLVRAGIWLAVAAFVLVLIAISHGVRPDLTQKMQQAPFTIGIAGSLLTGVLAAIASFLLSLPDRSRLWLLLPGPALAVWVATLGYGCLTAWVGLGPNGVRFDDMAECFASVVLTSVPLSAALLLMLRHAAPLRPSAATTMGSLAIAAITATGLLFFHSLDATVMILIWNLGVAAIIVTTGSVFGVKTLSWIAPRAMH